jgi:acetylornithine deacetylase/succinyl-diaminopimelate desuccinylase-like protein
MRSAVVFAVAALALTATGFAAFTVPTARADDDPSDDAAHRGAIADWVAAHRGEILDELIAFLSLPNVGTDVPDMKGNAAHLKRMLERRGLEVKRLETEASPYVFARLRPESASESTRTVLFYCHYDGQPVDPSRWTVGEPFVPTLVGEATDPDARLYARSASDDKSPIVALMAALDALRAAGLPPTIDAKFIFDPEEEMGSPHLVAVVDRHRELLAADMFVFADGPVHQSLRPTVVFGSRGIVTFSLTVYGPAVALHSGHYGNWAPNPAEKLAALLASMKDRDGRVLVEGFYDDVVPLSDAEREAVARIPDIEETLRHRLAFARADGGGKSLEELINLPSLNVRGMGSGWIGDEARTIVPATATAEIDLRLVRDVQPADQVARVMAHVRKQGFHVVTEAPDAATRRAHPNVALITHGSGTPAARTPMDLETSRALIAAVRRAVDGEPVLMPTLGGTGPLHQFESALGIPVYGVPIVNPDNNQHSPDENLRLGNLWDGIVVYASLFRM